MGGPGGLDELRSLNGHSTVLVLFAEELSVSPRPSTGAVHSEYLLVVAAYLHNGARSSPFLRESS